MLQVQREARHARRRRGWNACGLCVVSAVNKSVREVRVDWELALELARRSHFGGRVQRSAASLDAIARPALTLQASDERLSEASEAMSGRGRALTAQLRIPARVLTDQSIAGPEATTGVEASSSASTASSVAAAGFAKSDLSF